MRDLDALQKPERAQGIVSAKEGYVFLDGPDGLAITLTPIAAIQMGVRLIAAGKIAAQQQEVS